MAKQRRNSRREEYAEYSCITSCTIPVDINGQRVHKLYRTAGEFDYSAAHMQEGGIEESDTILAVEKGTIVPHHFAPENDIAFDDREDQLNNPADYIKDEQDMVLIAELMVDEGWFRDKHKSDEKGRQILDKTAVQLACDSIREMIGEDAAAAIDAGMEKSRLDAYNALAVLGKDEKDTRSQLTAMLKDAGVKMFWGADTHALINRVLDEGLYNDKG